MAALPPANCSSVLYDGAEGYRIGDITSSRFFRHSAGGMHFHQQRYPSSLAAAFLREYSSTSPRWRAYYNGSCGGGCVRKGLCQCYVPRAAALHHLIARRQPEPTAAHRAAQLRHTAAVHLRVGDVVDRSPYPLEEILRRPTRFSTRCAARELQAGCLAVSPSVYVLPLASYERLALTLRSAANVSRVVIVAAASHLWSGADFGKSCGLIGAVGAAFRRAGVRVSYRLGHHPDDDLVFFTTVNAMVPSAGGFSLLASEVARLSGVPIVTPDAGDGGRAGRSSAPRRRTDPDVEEGVAWRRALMWAASGRASEAASATHRRPSSRVT